MMVEDFKDRMKLATECYRAGRLGEAEEICRSVLSSQPNHLEAIRLLGLVAGGAGRPALALELIGRAATLDPNRADFQCNLGVAFQAVRRFDKAIAAHARAVRLDPGSGAFHYNLGCAYSAAGMLHEATHAYVNALRCDPGHLGALNNLGNCYQEGEKLDSAIEVYQRTIRLQPTYAQAHGNLGEALFASGQIDEALQSHRTAMSLAPDSPTLHSNYVYALNFDPDSEAKDRLAESLRWDEAHGRSFQGKIAPHENEASSERRLRIGYVSPDLRAHVVGWNLFGLWRERDRENYEVYAYADVPRPDGFSEELRGQCDCWRDITGVSDEEAAQMIRADGIDILVDLTLHMARNRLLIFARKPAPVQVSYLGYCGTTGLWAMDYRLSDWHLDPEGTDLSCYREETMRLARSYWCYRPGGATPEVGALPALAKGHVTFGCLNNFAKVSAGALELWAKILWELPKSRLLLQAPEGTSRRRVLEGLERKGVSRERIEFVGRQSWEGYVASLGQVDVALDPFPYGGGITTCDALWMGAPVVSLCGQTSVGRGGCSILKNLALSELLAETPRQYVEIAVCLARDLSRLGELRSTLRQRMEASPLREARGFARDTEAAYREMWRSWCSKGGPR